MLLLLTVWIISIPYVIFFGVVDSIAGKMGLVSKQNESFGGGVALIPTGYPLPQDVGLVRIHFLCVSRRTEMLRVLMRDLRCIMPLHPSS